MSLWSFSTPARISVPLSEERGYGIFQRIKNKRGVCLYQIQDGTWHEAESLPGNFDANADYMFGRTTRSSIPSGKGFAVTNYKGVNLVAPQDMGFESPLRIYRGGHVYVIDDTLKAELVAAVTTQEAGGYGAYISAYVPAVDTFGDYFFDVFGGANTPVAVGDEIAVSGRTAEYEQGVR